MPLKILRNESLKKHTSLRIGGPADHFCVPKNTAELREALLIAQGNRWPVAIIGAGTNLLVLDNGWSGLVIKLGGAAVMNAGAWGDEIGRYIEQVKVIDHEGNLLTLSKDQLGFGYRRSVLQTGRYIVAEVVIKLRKGTAGKIRKKIAGFLEKRKLSQPLGSPNAGSIFKNPPGKYAGKLLEAAGLKGARVGDAQVSVKHANFILNLGEAKARDVLKLMTRMQVAVSSKFKVKLEPELKIMIQSIR